MNCGLRLIGGLRKLRQTTNSYPATPKSPPPPPPKQSSFLERRRQQEEEDAKKKREKEDMRKLEEEKKKKEEEAARKQAAAAKEREKRAADNLTLKDSIDKVCWLKIYFLSLIDNRMFKIKLMFKPDLVAILVVAANQLFKLHKFNHLKYSPCL